MGVRGVKAAARSEDTAISAISATPLVPCQLSLFDLIRSNTKQYCGHMALRDREFLRTVYRPGIAVGCEQRCCAIACGHCWQIIGAGEHDADPSKERGQQAYATTLLSSVKDNTRQHATGRRTVDALPHPCFAKLVVGPHQLRVSRLISGSFSCSNGVPASPNADGYPMEGMWIQKVNAEGQIHDLTVMLRP